VVHHDAVARRSKPVSYSGPDTVDDTGRLMARNRLSVRVVPVWRGAVYVKIASAHSGRSYGDDYFARSGLRNGKVANFHPAVACKNDASHGFLPSVVSAAQAFRDSDCVPAQMLSIPTGLRRVDGNRSSDIESVLYDTKTVQVNKSTID
jgi:hypothetical protein